MSVNEIGLVPVERKAFISSRVLGILGIIGAPMLLMEMATRSFMNEPEKLNEQFVGALGIFYMGGWIASAIGMQRLRITGNSFASEIVFIIQIIGLILAFLFSAQELVGIDYETGGLLFTITDIAYPFSHVFMLIVGLFVWRAGVWRGVQRIAPFLVGVALPTFFVLISLAGMAVSSIGFASITCVGLGIIGYSVLKGKERLTV